MVAAVAPMAISVIPAVLRVVSGGMTSPVAMVAMVPIPAGTRFGRWNCEADSECRYDEQANDA